MGQAELAAAFWTRALENDSTQAAVALHLADLWARADRPDRAREVLVKSIAVNPQDPGLRLGLGRLEEGQGNLQAAEQAYRGAVTAKDTPETNRRLAQFLERAGRHIEAELVLRRVDMHNPSLPSALADLEMVSGRAPSAAQRYIGELDRLHTGSRKAAAEDAVAVSGIAARLVEADLGDLPMRGAATTPKPAVAQARTHLEQYRRDLDATTIAILEAEIALADGQPAFARSRAEAAVSTSPQSAAAHYVLGITRYAGNDKAGARTEWQSAVDDDETFLPARLALGRVCFEAGDTAGAGQQLAAVLREEPANLQALLLYARVLLAGRQYDAATALARRAAGLDTLLPEPEILLGEIGLQQGRAGIALIHFEKAVLLDPHDQHAIDGLTRVYRTGHVTRPMLQRMETIAGHEPASSTLFEVVGRLYADHGWYPDAIRALQSALRLEPKRATAAAALAHVFASSGEVSAAAVSAQRTGTGSGELVAGLQAQKRQDVGDAIHHYEAAVGRGEPSGAAANNLAWLYAEQGSKLDRALALAQSAREVAPENPAFLDTLGYVHLRRREYTAAIQALKAAIDLARARDPEGAVLPQSRQHLAVAYRLSGQPEEAEKITTQFSLPSSQ
jgi:tetratricopeptide (TPR) repeat protein